MDKIGHLIKLFDELEKEWGIDRTKVKVIGSSILSMKSEDIDVITYDIDTYNKLNYVSHMHKIHPMTIDWERWVILEDLMTFKNECCTWHDGKVIFSDEKFVEGKSLEFNEDSIKLFNKLPVVRNHIKKLLRNGYVISDDERQKLERKFVENKIYE